VHWRQTGHEYPAPWIAYLTFPDLRVTVVPGADGSVSSPLAQPVYWQ
jgi:hypothetical protein